MKHRALLVIFEKAAAFDLNCRLLQIVGGALCVESSPFNIFHIM